jgi:hypothetical protein
MSSATRLRVARLPTALQTQAIARFATVADVGRVDAAFDGTRRRTVPPIEALRAACDADAAAVCPRTVRDALEQPSPLPRAARRPTARTFCPYRCVQRAARALAAWAAPAAADARRFLEFELQLTPPPSASGAPLFRRHQPDVTVTLLYARDTPADAVVQVAGSGALAPSFGDRRPVDADDLARGAWGASFGLPLPDVAAPSLWHLTRASLPALLAALLLVYGAAGVRVRAPAAAHAHDPPLAVADVTPFAALRTVLGPAVPIALARSHYAPAASALLRDARIVLE